jgi:DNA-binding response OmpR family regulator
MANLLIFDDSVEILEMLQTVLQMHKHTVIVANTPEKFTLELKKQQPDLILIDVSLGVTDGRLICLKLKSTSGTEDIPIILISANPTLLNNYKEFCADASLAKPFDINELVEKINSLLP